MDQLSRRVTIKDVALRAGVSIGTVSRYIGNSGYVGKESKDKISRAIKELHYIPNATARSMINKKSRIIGVAVPEINNPFLADLVVRIESCLSREGYSIMLCNTGYNLKKTEAFVDDLIMRSAEGIILVATDISDKKLIEKIHRYMHGVSVGQKLPEFDCINFTDYKTAYDITNYLIENGHSRIACMGFNVNASQTIERLDGVISAVRDNGLPINEEYLLESEGGDKDGYALAKRLLELPHPPTAIVAINDFYAIGAYEAIYEKGLQVGDDISISGFDDIRMAKLISPSLTTVRCNTSEMARVASELLTDKIRKGGGGSGGRVVMLPSEIVLRDSIKPFARAGTQSSGEKRPRKAKNKPNTSAQ